MILASAAPSSRDDRTWLTLRPPEWQLVLPLALAFVGFFAAPLLILAVVSAFDNEELTTVGFAMWASS